MYELDRTVAGQDRTFKVYTLEEAEEEGIPYTDWRMAREGEWCRTDDDYVGECVKVQKYPKPEKNRISFFFTFSFARKWLTRNKDDGSVVGNPHLSFEDRKEKKAYWSTSAKDWVEVELQKTRAKRALNLYATLMVANEGTLTDKEWEMIGESYRPQEEIPAATARRFFNNDRVQKVAQQKVAELFEDAGITERSVVENMEQLRKKAEEDGSYNTAYRILEKQMELLNLEERAEAAGQLPSGDGQPRDIEDAKILDEMEGDLDDRPNQDTLPKSDEQS